MGIKFKLDKSADKEIYFIAKGRNGETVAVSESYSGASDETNARGGVLSMLQAALDADIPGTAEIVEDYIWRKAAEEAAGYEPPTVWGNADIDYIDMKDNK